jgi:hypothetical protein
MSPIALTDSQMVCVQDAARHIPPWQRSAFLERLAELLQGNGYWRWQVHRACRAAAAETVRKRSGRLAGVLFGRA